MSPCLGEVIHLYNKTPRQRDGIQMAGRRLGGLCLERCGQQSQAYQDSGDVLFIYTVYPCTGEAIH